MAAEDFLSHYVVLCVFTYITKEKYPQPPQLTNSKNMSCCFYLFIYLFIYYYLFPIFVNII